MLDAKLQSREEIVVPQRLLQWITAADLSGDGQLQWCALTARKLGDNLALGINLKGEELWNYPLPEGVPAQSTAIEPIIAGKVTAGGSGQWLLPGADGSIHIVAADGKLVDRFNYGAVLTGLATRGDRRQAGPDRRDAARRRGLAGRVNTAASALPQE